MNKIANFLNSHIDGLVTDKPEILASVSRDASILEIMPKLLCIPKSPKDIQYLLNFLNELAKKGYHLPLAVRGSGLDRTGADLSEGIVVSTKKLNKIQEIDDRGRLVRVQAGVTLGQLNSALSLFGLRLPVEADERETLGGLVSNFYTDKIAKKYGSIYYYLDQLEVILANGEMIQTQSLTKYGIRLATKRPGLEGELYTKLPSLIVRQANLIEKLCQNTHNHAGFRMISEVNKPKAPFDLAPLFFGTQGSLGVITEMILRVVPVSRPIKRILLTFATAKQAIEVMSKIQTLNPLRIDFYDSRLFKLAASMGEKADFLQELSRDRFFVHLEFDDPFFKIKKNLKKIEEFKNLANRILIEQTDLIEQFCRITKIIELYQNDPLEAERVIIADNVYLPEQRLADFIEELTSLEQIFNQPLPLFGSFSTSLYSLRPSFDLSYVNERKQLLRFLQQYGKLVEKHHGSFAGGSGEGRVQAIIFNQTLPVKTRAVYYEIKRLFDPNNILNPKIKQSATLADIVRFLRTSPQIGLIRKD